LRQVAAEEFIPPPTLVEAAAELGVIGSAAGPRLYLRPAAEAVLSREIEAFADAYWSIKPIDRRARADELSSLARPYPRLADRLIWLRDGLDLEPAEGIPDPTQARLAAAIYELYPLKPAVRARRRFYLLAEVGSRDDQESAARALRRTHPTLARIDHELLQGVAQGSMPVTPLPMLERPTPASERREYADFRPAAGNNYRWLWLLMIPGCLGVMRAVTNQPPDGGRNSVGPSGQVRSRDVDDYRYTPSPAIKETIARTLAERRTIRVLSAAQRDLLEYAATKSELTDAEARNLAAEFVARPWKPFDSDKTESRLKSSFERRPESEWTAEQREIQRKFTDTAAPRVDDIQRLFHEFVKAGRLPPKVGVPPDKSRPKP
jgi:hypothetical protein